LRDINAPNAIINTPAQKSRLRKRRILNAAERAGSLVELKVFLLRDVLPAGISPCHAEIGDLE
jgi:hypothetical protein